MSASHKSSPAKAIPAKPSLWEARWFPFCAGGLLVLAALAAYHNSFSGPFIFDDEIWITQNPTIRHLWPISPVLMPPPGLVVRGRPVFNLSLAINYALSGDGVWSYHLLNLAIHITAGLALFGIMRRTLRRPVMRERFPAGAGLALAVAAIWMLHPLQTESITYIVQRAESLMGMFYLLTLYGFIRGVEAGAERPEARRRIPESSSRSVDKIEKQPGRYSLASVLWFLSSVISCLLGMATKEVMVSAPVIVLLYDRTFLAGSFREAWRQRWRVHLCLAATWIELGCLMVGIGGRGEGFNLGITAQTYALTECSVVIHYLWLAFWPHPLVLDYGGDVVRHLSEAAPYASILMVLVAGAAIALWRWPVWGFAGAWFFGILAATSSFVPVAYQPMAEHRMYLPLAAVAAVAVLGIYAGLGRKSAVVFLALAVGCGWLTARRNEDYRSELAIWGDTVAKHPGNPRAQNYLALTLAHAGRLTEALGHFQEATRLKADFADAYNNTGTCLFMLNRVADAVGQYEQALQYKPDFIEAQFNLGDALFRLGRFGEAAQHYQAAVRLKPDYVDARLNLAAAWERTGRITESIGQYREALRYKPDDAMIHCDLADALASTGGLAEATEHYGQALRIDPGLAQARAGLARLQAQQPSVDAEK